MPTQICYIGAISKWGFAIPENRSRHQWFKLGLDKNQKHPEISLLAIDFPDSKALPPGHENDPDEARLTTDYLTHLREHTTKILRRKLGDTIVDTTPISYIVTVPAIWSDAAKAKTRRCAAAAGMGQNIRMISEPEAAAIYALDAMDPGDFKVGDRFALCDAGGGTVDVISKFCLFTERHSSPM